MADENGREKQVVVFKLANEEFGVDIASVREIIRYTEITQLPETPEYVEGVISLRGEVLPVIDLRKRFGIPSEKTTEQTRIIIVEMNGSLVGLIVDAVTEVLSLSAESIQPPPQSVAGLRRGFLQGIGKLDDRLIIILRVDKILSSQEQIELRQGVQAEAAAALDAEEEAAPAEAS